MIGRGRKRNNWKGQIELQNNYLELEVGPFQAMSIDTGTFGTFSLGSFGAGAPFEN